MITNVNGSHHTTEKYVYHHHCFFPIRNMLMCSDVMWCDVCVYAVCYKMLSIWLRKQKQRRQQQQQHLVLKCVTTNITVVDLCAALLRSVFVWFCVKLSRFYKQQYLLPDDICAHTHTQKKHPVSICSTLEQHFVRFFLLRYLCDWFIGHSIGYFVNVTTILFFFCLLVFTFALYNRSPLELCFACFHYSSEHWHANACNAVWVCLLFSLSVCLHSHSTLYMSSCQLSRAQLNNA